MVALGVGGYVLKDDAPRAVIDAVHSVSQGGTWFSPQIMASLVRDPREAADTAEVPHLTRREKELLTLVTRGWDNKRIAAELGLGEQTTRNYLHVLYQKRSVSTRVPQQRRGPTNMISERTSPTPTRMG